MNTHELLKTIVNADDLTQSNDAVILQAAKGLMCDGATMRAAVRALNDWLHVYRVYLMEHRGWYVIAMQPDYKQDVLAEGVAFEVALTTALNEALRRAVSEAEAKKN